MSVGDAGDVMMTSSSQNKGLPLTIIVFYLRKTHLRAKPQP
jgi:hypothetical protein